MKKLGLLLIPVALLIFIVSGCLTVEKKEYTIEMTGPNSGKFTIKYINLLSSSDDSTDVSAEDFEELLSNYIYGHAMETDFPEAINIQKRLFEENGVLCGEVTMEFDDLSAVKLYRYQNSGPYMMNIGLFLDTETYFESNGEYGGDHMPVVFWPERSKVLTLTTYVTTPDETSFSLVDHYREWRENN